MPIIISGGSGGGLPGVTVSGTAASGKTVVASSSSAAAWAYPPGFEIGYAQITTNANITDTSEATATALITVTATFDGGAVYAEVFAARVVTPAGAAGDTVTFTLFEGSTEITLLGNPRAMIASAGSQWAAPLHLKYKFTPTAASHTYKLCAFVQDTTGTPVLVAGAGSGAGTAPPSYLRFVKV